MGSHFNSMAGTNAFGWAEITAGQVTYPGRLAEPRMRQVSCSLSLKRKIIIDTPRMSDEISVVMQFLVPSQMIFGGVPRSTLRS